MTDPVGLSIGTTNLVAARVGTQPVTRRSVLTLYDHRATGSGSAVGEPQPDRVRGGDAGFVERVGDPVPLVAVGRFLPSGRAPARRRPGRHGRRRRRARRQNSSIAVPAHWGSATVRALSGAGTRSQAGSHRCAAAPGVRCRRRTHRPADRAGSDRRRRSSRCSTSAAAAPASRWSTPPVASSRSARPCAIRSSPVTRSTRRCFRPWSPQVTGADDADPAATAAVGSLTRLRDECRQAKERLSAETATGLAVDLPGFRVRDPFHPNRTREPDRPAAGRCDRRRRGSVAAQRPNVVRRVDGRHRGRRREYSSRHATSLRAKPGPCGHHGPAWARTPPSARRCWPRAPTRKRRRVSARWLATPRPPGSAESGTSVRHWRGRRTTTAHRSRCPTPRTNPYAIERTGARPRVAYIPPTGPISTPARPGSRLPQFADRGGGAHRGGRGRRGGVLADVGQQFDHHDADRDDRAGGHHHRGAGRTAATPHDGAPPPSRHHHPTTEAPPPPPRRRRERRRTHHHDRRRRSPRRSRRPPPRRPRQPRRRPQPPHRPQRPRRRRPRQPRPRRPPRRS